MRLLFFFLKSHVYKNCNIYIYILHIIREKVLFPFQGWILTLVVYINDDHNLYRRLIAINTFRFSDIAKSGAFS